MAGYTQVGAAQSLQNSVNTIRAEFKEQMIAQPLGRKICDIMPLEPGEGPTKYITTYGRLTARALTEGVDITEAQQITDSSASYSPSEIGLKVVITDLSERRTADRKLRARTGRLMAQAMARKEDEDVMDQFPSFTTAALGGAGIQMGVGHLNAAYWGLSIGHNRTRGSQEPAPPPWHGVFHPCQLSPLVGNLVPLSAYPSGSATYEARPASPGTSVGPGRTAWSDDILKRGWAAVGTLWGMQIFLDANISVDSSDDATGACFSKEGIIIVPELEASAIPQGGGGSGPGETLDVSLRAVEIVARSSYAVGIYRPAAYGREITSDATIPTS